MAIEGVLEKGFVTTSLDSADQLGAQWLDVADDASASPAARSR